MSWHHVDWSTAACRDEDPELFFPIGNGELGHRQAHAAKAVCRRCSLRSRCLRWALDNASTEGVWGGHTEQERRALLHAHRVRR